VVGSHEDISLQGAKLFANLRCLILISSGLKWKSFFKVVGAFMEVH